MQTFTIGLTPRSVIDEALPHKYPMKLNREDMHVLLVALYVSWQTADDEETADAALSLRTSILSTLEIEEV